MVEWRAENGFVSRLTTVGGALIGPYVNVNQCKKKSLCESIIINSGHLNQQKMTKGVYEM